MINKFKNLKKEQKITIGIVLIFIIIVIFVFINNKGNNINIKNVKSSVLDANRIVCKRASSLHTEECHSSNCRDAGYSYGDIITYGSLGNVGTVSGGDAFDCDVNGDGVYDPQAERFYYISDYYLEGPALESNKGPNAKFDSNYAILVYYSPMKNGVASTADGVAYDSNQKNYNGPVSLIEHLPTTATWSNVELKTTTRQLYTEKGNTTNKGYTLPKFNYSGYSARPLTYAELHSGCPNARWGINGVFDYCQYLMEKTSFTTETYNTDVKVSHVWLETPADGYSNAVFAIEMYGRKLWSENAYGSSYYGFKPVIEVNKNNIDFGSTTGIINITDQTSSETIGTRTELCTIGESVEITAGDYEDYTLSQTQTVTCAKKTNVTLNYTQNVYFPDANFNKCVIKSYNRDFTPKLSEDHLMTKEEAKKITYLDCGNYSNTSESEYAHSAEGIELLENVTNINLSRNAITSIDLSHNTKLEILYLDHNSLTTVDVSNNRLLKKIDISWNYTLASIDVRNLSSLERLELGRNYPLNNIDLSYNTQLNYLSLNYTGITSLDITNNPLLTDVWVNQAHLTTFMADGNTVLENLTLSNNYLIDIDLSTLTSVSRLDVQNNNLTYINLRNLTELNEAWLGDNPYEELDISRNTKLTKIGLTYDNTNTTLQELNLGANTLLETLYLSNLANLKILNLNNNVNLKTLNLQSMNIDMPLDLSECTGLTSVTLKDIFADKITMKLGETLELARFPSGFTTSFRAKNVSNSSVLSRVGSYSIEAIKLGTDVTVTYTTDGTDSYTFLVDVVSAVTCGEHEELNQEGTACNCVEGYSKVGLICQLDCEENEELNSQGTECICKNGYHRVNGVCEAIPTCLEHEKLNQDQTQCVCESGYSKVNGVCTYNCGNNEQVNSTNDGCDCVSGYHKVNNVCTLIPTCNEHEELNQDQTECNCVEGYEKQDGVCTKIETLDISELEVKNETYPVIEANTTYKSLKETVGETLVVKRGETVLEPTAKLATGDTFEYNNETYTIVIDGDMSKDGEVTNSDLVYAYDAWKGRVQAQNEIFLAGDSNGDGRISNSDLSKMYAMWKGR